MEEGKVLNAFKKIGEGLQDFMDELAEPSDYAKAKICLDLAREGMMIDPLTGDVTGEVDPESNAGIENINNCIENLRIAEKNIPISPCGGPP